MIMLHQVNENKSKAIVMMLITGKVKFSSKAIKWEIGHFLRPNAENHNEDVVVMKIYLYNVHNFYAKPDKNCPILPKRKKNNYVRVLPISLINISTKY